MHRTQQLVRVGLKPAFVLGICLVLQACAAASLWPFGRKAEPAPTPVTELVIAVPAESAMPVVLQFWERNTLVLDLQDVPSTGRLVLSRREDQPWPARLAFRMSPSRFETLEVRGAVRLLLPVSRGGSEALIAELPAAAYRSDTTEIGLAWGAASAF